MRTRDMIARRTALAGMLALGGALLLGSAGPAEAATFQITSCPYEITVPGTYVLTRDLTCGGGPPAIQIRANNVRLILGNHTISASDNGGGIVGHGTNLSIVGGTVTGFVTGVYLGGLSGGLSTGISVVGVNASGNSIVGITFESCSRCSVAGSRANDNGRGGIFSFGEGSAVRVVGNTAKDNGIYGIIVDNGSTGNYLTGNTATGNASADLADLNLPACVNLWRGNRFVTDNETGAAFGPGAGCIR